MSETEKKNPSALGRGNDEKSNENILDQAKIFKSAKEGKQLEQEIAEMDALYQRLFIGNRQFVAEKSRDDPKFFEVLSKGQTPKYLLIGCSDSRVPPNMLTKTEPGEMFIHRNVANLVVNSDMNVMAVIQYAVEVLLVKHIIVMGHYGCGGVKASMGKSLHGFNIDTWLRNIKDVQRLHWQELTEIQDEEERFRLLVELNVREQVFNLCKTTILQGAWASGHTVAVHGWVYDIKSGLLKELHILNKHWQQMEETYAYNFRKDDDEKKNVKEIDPNLMVESRIEESLLTTK